MVKEAFGGRARCRFDMRKRSREKYGTAIAESAAIKPFRASMPHHESGFRMLENSCFWPLKARSMRVPYDHHRRAQRLL